MGPTFSWQLRKNPGKPQPGKLTRPEIEPGPAGCEATMLPLNHRGGRTCVCVCVYMCVCVRACVCVRQCEGKELKVEPLAHEWWLGNTRTFSKIWVRLPITIYSRGAISRNTLKVASIKSKHFERCFSSSLKIACLHLVSILRPIWTARNRETAGKNGR